jgi:hypothetical protein
MMAFRGGTLAVFAEILLGAACGSSAEPLAPAHGPPNTPEAGSVDARAPDIDMGTMAEVMSPEGSSDATDGGARLDREAPPLDAGKGDGGRDTSIESISVRAGSPASFQTSLAAGAIYLLKATGSVEVGAHEQDAEFDFARNQAVGADSVNGVDVGIDVGLLEPHPMNHTTMVPPGPARMKWFGSYRSDHVYYLAVTGAGKPLTLALSTSNETGGAGAIFVSLFELRPPPLATYASMPSSAPPPPAPPPIGAAALETIQVPLAKTVASGKIATNEGAVYLLQASGVGQVSRGTITPNSPHMGDAEYMDWPADGSKFNDGECGADFGIGVDEIGGPAPCTGGAVYVHRTRWWGPYRNDHIYYVLYAGTGKPISFLYYDSGYGDNSMTETITVQVFPAP